MRLNPHCLWRVSVGVGFKDWGPSLKMRARDPSRIISGDSSKVKSFGYRPISKTKNTFFVRDLKLWLNVRGL